VKSIEQERRPPFLDLVRMVMDHQLLDSDYVECGKVDDVELEIANGELRATAILSGPGPASTHLPRWAGALTRALFGRRATRIPWGEVALVDSRVKLRSTSESLGLGEAERAASRGITRVPGAQ
jgi:sporulation protein YlmC with PRC-barrel domain